MISCYNRGCGQNFDPENNPDGKTIHFFDKIPSSANKFESHKLESEINVGFFCLFSKMKI